jgi:hypothetical protein
VSVVLDALTAVGEPVKLAFHWRPMVSDPADDMVLETALNGRAEPEQAREVLERAGKGNPPIPGNELRPSRRS